MKKLPTTTTDKFKKDYLDGMTVIDIGRKYGCNQVTVSKYLKKLGITISPVPPKIFKYGCDVDYFKEINTESKAYWLGFILAEGWLSESIDRRSSQSVRSYRMGIELSVTDIAHLAAFKSAVKSEAKISQRSRPGKYNTIKLCCIRIGDATFCLNLAKYTGIGSKSNTIKMPELSVELKRHLVRGFFDGEGSVYIQKTGRQKTVSITSNAKHFLEEIAMLLDFPVKIYQYKNKNCFKLSVSRQEYLLKFYNYLYADASIYLPRKRLKFDELSRSIEKSIDDNL
jgi:intein/homing endonuclease